MSRRKRKFTKQRGAKGTTLTRVAGLGEEVSAFLARMKANKMNKLQVEKDKLQVERDRIAKRAETIQNYGIVKDAIGALGSIRTGIDMWGNTTKNQKLAERFPGLDDDGYFLEQDMYEVNPEYADTGFFEGYLPGGKKPKWAVKGSDRVQKTPEYLQWLEEGSIDYSNVATRNTINEQQKLLDSWTESDPNFRVSTTHDGYVPGQDIVMGGQQSGGGPGMIGAKVGQTPPIDTVPMTDYLMDEGTMIGGDIGQQFGIGKNSRGQIIDLDSGAVMDEKLLNARINLKKTEVDLAISEKPAITTIDKPKTIDPVKDVYTDKKLGGWKGKLGVYDTASGFEQASEGQHWLHGAGWQEVPEGQGMFGGPNADLNYDFGVTDALVAYNIYSNYTTTDWDGQGMGDWSHDEWGAGLQMLGSSLYFVPVPGARMVGSIISFAGKGIEKYGGKDEDWWFGENSAIGKIFGN